MRITVLALLALTPSLSFGQVVINPSGGTSAANGIRVTIGNTGQMQVLRNGTGQLYSPTQTAQATTNSSMTNGIYLAVGTTVTGPANFRTTASTGVTLQAWTPISNTVTPQGSGGTATTVLRATVGGRNYDLTVTWQYIYPNDFVSVTHSLIIPAGNTSTVRLYHVMDAFLGGDDFGPSFFSLGPPALVGGYRPASNIVEAWRFRSGIAWSGYFAGFYSCLFDETACPVGQNNSVNAAVTFTNYVEPTTVDNSFGIMWNFGAAPGTYASINDLTFYSFQPQLSKRFGATALTSGQSTTLTFTIDNVPGALPQTNLGFTDTFPSGLVMANGTVTNTCGGSVTTAAGGTIATGSSSVKLAAGGFASGATRCTITVNVTSSTAGAYVNGKANISGVSVLENQVSDQTLSVVIGPPVVTLATPGTINIGNANAYRVSGSCQDSNGVVSVRVGSLPVQQTPCSNNAFGVTLSVVTLADSAAVSVSASQSNAAGTGTGQGSAVKDTVAPGVPSITAPAAGAFISDNTPTIAGTGEVGATVRVFVGTTEICSTIVTGAGNWSCTSGTLTDGTDSLTTRATDAAGNTGFASPGRNITIDTQAPPAPIVSNPASAATVAPNPTVSGTSEPSATVVVFEGTTQLCNTPADGAGQWSCPTTLGTGSHTITARQSDRAGNQGPATTGRTFVVANVPLVTLDTPGPINAANVTSVAVAGNCTAGSGPVAVRLSTLTAVNPNCGSNGRFSATLNASSLSDGPALVLTASQTNVTGTGTDTRSVVKDTVAPTTPGLVTPAEGAYINTTTPTFTGTGEAGSTVRVTRSGVELCSTVVPQSGQWACTSSVLLPGTVSITAQATDPAENGSGVSPVRTLTIDTQAPAEPIILTPTVGASVAPQPSLTGTAEPFATVSVFEGAALVCSVTADATGAWSCNTVLGTGPHTVVAKQTDRASNASPDSSPRTFTVQGLPNVLLNTPLDLSSANTGAYVVTGACTSTAGSVTVAVGLISTMVPCAGGMFSATIDARALGDGMVTVRASQTTAAGTGSDTRTVSKDATAPASTSINEPKTGSVTTMNTPRIEGTAEAGATVTIYVNGNLVGSTTANSMGAWSFTPPTPIADGTYVVSVTARDRAGNESAQVMGPTFTIDSVAPTAPVIIQPVANESIDADRSMTVTGAAEPYSKVVIYVDGVQVAETYADDKGRFSHGLEPAQLGAGTHTVEADATDAAGNKSPRSAVVPFTIHSVDERFAGQGLIGCSAAGGVELLGVLALLGLRRRREVRS